MTTATSCHERLSNRRAWTTSSTSSGAFRCLGSSRNRAWHGDRGRRYRGRETYDRLYELVDGVLVEKGMGFCESLLAAVLIQILRNFVSPRNLGVVSAPDGTIRLFPG